jgi:2-polyprenyl-6-methoxyphenol hydroxylase-like FAD-dependent oxidoreductase
MTIPCETDVFIAGGGPAGLAAAIAARERGLSVVIADVCQPPIEKPCGEGLLPDALAALRRLGVTVGPQASYPFRGIRFLGGDAVAEASFPDGCGLGIRRPALHRLLVERAVRAGARLVWNARVSGISPDGVVLDGVMVRSRWIIGADGVNSRIRRWAGLGRCTHDTSRFGFRRHYRVAPWSDCVEIYWGYAGQFYITPVSPQEICAVFLSQDRRLRMDDALPGFPELQARLRGAVAADAERGAISVSRRFRAVVRGRVALIGDASASVDAVTGQGLCLAFRQAWALADALASGDLRPYAVAHRRMLKRPVLMERLMLLMDRSPWVQRRALGALAARPAIFSSLLAAHVGSRRVTDLVMGGVVPLSWRMLTTRQI